MAEGQSRARRASRYTEPPERVQNAAQQMQNPNYPPRSSSGYPNGQDPQQAYYQQEMLRRQEMARQEEIARQQYAWQMEQQRLRRQMVERERVSSQTSRQGAFRGYTGEIPSFGPGNGGGRTPGQRGKSVGLALAVTALVLMIAVGGFFALRSYLHTREIHEAVSPYDNLFVQGVYVDGIHLGGMTPEQGLNSVQSRIQRRNDAWNVTLTYQGTQLAQINAGMLGMSVDIGQVLNEAWAQGHTGDEETRYAAMQALLETPYEAYTAIPSGDTSVIDNVLNQVKAQIDRPATNAQLLTFDPTLSYPFTFQKEATGLNLDTEEIREELYHMVATMSSGQVELQPEVIQPGVRQEDLMKHYMLRSSVYTSISTSSTEERNKNIRRSLDLINGYVLQPGNQFSFNSVVGQRTEENGFYPAIEYAYGEHVMGIGGGVCQASTTLYQAAVCAGLQIVKRVPHSDAVNYTEYGKDATVYWMGKRKIDLVFKNNTEEPVYFVAGVQQDPSNRRRLIARVTIYGQDMGDVRYEIECKTVQELDPPEKPIYVKDKDATYVTYTDQEKSVAKAKPGYVVESYRVKYAGSTEVERVMLYSDTYEPKAERIYVGVTKRSE